MRGARIMGSLTIEVERYNAGVTLREEFAVPASQEPADHDRLKVILAEIRGILRRIEQGDDRMYSEVLGCWVRVTG
jgi:hypothetical protein